MGVVLATVAAAGLAPGSSAASAPPEPAGGSFTVTNDGCPCRIWSPATVPTVSADPDTTPLELGVKFRSSVAGYITGIRFYKDASNTGPHSGSLWTSAGVLLARAPFTGETASGWQAVAFESAVPITANTTYVASYHTSVGHYSEDDYYFASSVNSPPLEALADEEDGPNGVYAASSTSTFPTNTYCSANYWVDVVFATTIGPDLTPATVTTVSPANGATTAPVNATITAAFSEALEPSTVSDSTFILRAPLGGTVSAAVTYDTNTHTAILTPAAALAYATTYTAMLSGGTSAPRIQDQAGNALASDYAWSFTTASPLAPPNEGPGGPILVVTSAANPFTGYYAEILRAEGLNEFTVSDISLVTAALLANYDVVILGDLPVSAGQVTLFSNWVNAGGNLVAMHPDKQLAGLLGLTGASGTLANAYLRIYGTGAGAGIVTTPIQFHGSADRYTLSGATALASLYSDATTDTLQPAVALRSVGLNGGHAAAFTFDLARSVVYTRQGNPAWAGQERDGQSPIRSDDLFYGHASFDPKPDWVDLNKAAIPQADEQQRLLANLILQMNAPRKPLPRFWYLPRGLKAAVVMTGDQHGCCDGTSSRFQQYVAQSPTNGSVADWECVRASSYIYASSAMTDAQAKSWTDQGFELGIHVNTGCADWTPASLATSYSSQMDAFAALYPSIPGQVSHRTHCVAWSDWATQPKIELAHGIRLDVNYYYWPQSWVQNRPGFLTGSGMPMRFADLDGTLIDCYQAATQMTDESGQTYPFTIDRLLDGALGPSGYYGVFTCNFHTDNAAPYAPSDATVASAQARGVPVVSGRQMLEWLDGRNNSSFGAITWNGGVLGFMVVAASGSRNLQAMVPTSSSIGPLSGIRRDGTSLAYSRQTSKGIEYAFFPATSGTYRVSYAPDTTPPVLSAVTANPGVGGVATITWTTDEPADSRLAYGTAPGSLDVVAADASLVTAHSLRLSGLVPVTTYYYRVTSADAANNSAIWPTDAPASFIMPSAAFVDTTAANFEAGSAGACAAVTRQADGEVILAPALNDDFSGTALSSSWQSATWPSGSGPALGGGVLTLNGAHVATAGSFGPGSALEFLATFQASPFQNVGFASNLGLDVPWVTFGTSSRGNGVYARTSAGTDILISASLLDAPHRYRINWNSGSFAFYVDGSLVQTVNFTVAGKLVVAMSDYTMDAASLQVDWLRVAPYATPCTFLSRVLDAGVAVNWSVLSWTALTPAGTTLGLSYRMGNVPTPDSTWSGFRPVSSSGSLLEGTSRYLQYSVQLATADTTQTPVLQDVTVNYLLCPAPTIMCVGNVVTAPSGPAGQVVSGIAPVSQSPGCGSPTVTWTAPGATPASGTNDASGTLFPPGVTTVTYTITNRAGSVARCSFTVTVPARPTAVVSGTTAICRGSTATITAALTGQGPWNVTYFDGTTNITHTGVGGTGTTGTDTLSVRPTATTAYAVTALSDANGPAQAADVTGGAVVTVNTPPGAPHPNASYSAARGLSLQVSLPDLLASWSGASLSVQSAGPASSQGGVVSLDSRYLYYLAPTGSLSGDSIPYTVGDANGCTTTASIDVRFVPNGVAAQQITSSGGRITITFAGISGYQYDVQRAAGLSFASPQTVLTTNASAAGVFSFSEPAPGNAAYYRLVQH